MVIGVTGGMGCGKSEAVLIFKELGFIVVDSDAIVRELYADDDAVRGALRERFGDGVFDEGGQINRDFIAKKVFGEEGTGDLEWLEELLHPKVKALRDKLIQSNPEVNWVAEVPLLFEKSLEKDFDYVVCLSSSKEVQLARLFDRGLSREAIDSRMVRQLPLEEKEKRADYVILNNDTKDNLRQKIIALLKTL